MSKIPAAAGFFSFDASSGFLANQRFGAETFRSVLSLWREGTIRGTKYNK